MNTKQNNVGNVTMIEARRLRFKDELKFIPNDMSGLYFWWAEESEYLRLLEALGVSRTETDPFVRRDGNLFCIYVGIAVNESIRSRLNWHVNDAHTASKVKNGTLSTLRQSISSLIAHNQYDKESTNDFVDKLTIEYRTYNWPVRDKAGKSEIENMEKKMMNENLYILNIRDNKHEKATEIKKSLRKIRKTSKNIGV